MLPFQCCRALGGAAACLILLPSADTGNVCSVGFPLQKQLIFCAKIRKSLFFFFLYHHLSAVLGRGVAGGSFKVTFPKLEETL